MLSYSFYLILFGAFFCILASAVLITVYVYRKWKNEHRMLKISRRDLRVAHPVHRGRTSDYGDDDPDDVPSEKRQYSDDDRSRNSEDMSKHSEDFSTKQSEIWARVTTIHCRINNYSVLLQKCSRCERVYRLDIDQYKCTVIRFIYTFQKYLSITREVSEREPVYLCNKGHRFLCIHIKLVTLYHQHIAVTSLFIRSPCNQMSLIYSTCLIFNTCIYNRC